MKVEFELLTQIVSKAYQVARDKYNLNSQQFFELYSQAYSKKVYNETSHTGKSTITVDRLNELSYDAIDLTMRYLRRNYNK